MIQIPSEFVLLCSYSKRLLGDTGERPAGKDELTDSPTVYLPPEWVLLQIPGGFVDS